MNGMTSYILSKKYVESTVDSLGSLKGAPCTIKSQTETDDSYIITFEWTGTSGVTETSQLTIKKPKDGIDGLPGKNGKDGSDGADGLDGVGISKIEKIGTVDLVDTYRITFTDGSTFDYEVKNGKDGQGGTGGSGEENKIEVIKVNGVEQTIAADKSVDITVPSIEGLTKDADLATVAKSGDYEDLINKPTIPDAYDDTVVKSQIQAVANGLMDSVGYSADYKTIDIIAKNSEKKSIDVAPIISHASITELSDVDTTNKATGKALVYNATTSKHEYADVSGTDEKVKMDASTDAKYLGELLDNVTITNENGELKVKKLDGQEVTITEINYLKGLTMNVMDLVNMFSNGGVKIINTPVATYAELLTLDKSSFIEGISYLVYVLADENHDNAKTTYLVDKDSEIPTYFGFADSQRDFTTNPIDLATEITGKLGISNMDSDAIKALFTVDDTYKTETATNNAFSTHGAKALYDELLLAIGNKANDSDLTTHKDDANIHVRTEDRTKWDSAKTHADSAHAPSNAQENILETVKVNGTALEVSDKAVNVTVPTKVSELTDSADYAKTADIPTTLPANGGNADTVNNHTVNSDVPENAVFTDTIYDDTEVKESIAELSSNLSQLEFGTDSGAKNLFKPIFINAWQCTCTIDEDDKITLISTGTSGVSYARIGTLELKGNTTYTFNLIDNSGNLTNIALFTDNTTVVKYITESNITYIPSEDMSVTLCAYVTIGSGNTASFKLMVTTDGVHTVYEPYIPSVKMLAEENAQQSSDLDGLGYGENGAKNLFEDEIKWIENITVERGTKSVSDGKITLTATSDDCYTHHYANTWKNNGIKTIPCKPNTTYTLSWEYEGDSIGDVYIFENGSINNIGYTINKSHKLLITTSADAEYLTVRVGVRNSGTSITYWNFQLEEGDTATPYEPYIPSVKMLAEENAQQNTEAMDLKMLGWTVPSECPVQNTFSGNTFTQRVGRVDLGSLEWTYLEDNLRFYATITEREPIYVNNTDIYCSKYTTVIISSDNADKTIGSAYHKTPSDIGVRDLSYTDATAFKSANNGVYVYYELATPITMTIDGNEATERINDSLSVIGKCKNLLKPTLKTTEKNGVTCTNNGDGTYTLNGTATANTDFTLMILDNLEVGKKYKLVGCPSGGSASTYYLGFRPRDAEENRKDIGSGVTFNDLSTSNVYAVAIIVLNGTTVTNLTFKPMLTENLNATFDDFVPYTGDGDTLTHDVAEIKNDLSVKKFELVAGTLWLCVSGKHCVLTLNGYNLTESTHFDKLEEYQPYLVARNVVSKGDSVCIAAVEPNGNINASDLVVGTQLTGQLFGEISWIANI